MAPAVGWNVPAAQPEQPVHEPQPGVAPATSESCHPEETPLLSEYHEMTEPAATATLLGPTVPLYETPSTVSKS